MKGEVSRGDDATAETHGGGLADAQVRLADRPDFSREPELAKEHGVGRKRSVAETAEDGGKESQIGSRLIDLKTAGRIDIDVAPHHGDVHPLLQHCDKQGDPIVIKTRGRAPGRSVLSGQHQGLDLDQDRACSLHGAGDRTAGNRLFALAQEQIRRVKHRDQAPGGHLEHADLVRRTESVLDRSDNPVIVVPFALKIENRIDDVLQRLGTGDAAVFGDVADQKTGISRLFARVRNCAATCRTWLMLPGAESSVSEYVVCTESTTMSVGCTSATADRIASRLDSAKI